MKLPLPVIVVPGITATYLTDEYLLPPDTVWSVLTKDYQRIRLHPDNVRFEADEPARLRAGQIMEVAYKELVSELRHNLSPRADAPVPVYPFSYDWRQPLIDTEKQLADFVAEVIARTKLMRHYAADGYTDVGRVNLVGHSMGGLIIAGYLANENGAAPVGKVATLASPFRGSFEAVIQMITGTADMGGSAPSAREREAARVTPALYHLLPTVKRGLETERGMPASLFNPDLWQPSVLDTITEYVRLYAVDPGRKSERDKQALDLFKSLLRTAEEHRRKIENLRLEAIGLPARNWLAVVGVGAETRVKLRIAQKNGAPEFVLRSADRMNHWENLASDKAEGFCTGDGTVPYEGAIPGFLNPENLVCVSPKDFGYWEVSDRLLASVAGFHGILPNMDMLHRLIVRHFTGARDDHGNTWGRRPPGVGAEQWQPPLELRDKTAG